MSFFVEGCMRWFIIALSLFFPATARSAVYEFSVSTDYTTPLPRSVGFYIDLATPSAGQSASLSWQIANPDNGPLFVFENIQALSFAQNGNATNHLNISGTIDTGNLCPFCIEVPIAPIFDLGIGSTRLQIVATIIGTGPQSAFFTLEIPDELGPSIATSVPETSTWAMMLIGFFVISLGVKKQRERSINKIAPVARA